jgi:TRAP-type C4-dicarboxylate transport system substrate-binding protein
MIRLVFSPPTAVIAMQWHDKLSFRLSREIIPTMGVLLVDLERWNTLPRNTRKKVRQIVDLEIARLNKAVLKTNDKAIEVLERRGMETIQVNDELAQIVVDASEQVAQRLADKAFSKSFLERILKAAADYREKNAGK